jgi:cyclopropane-fatty-acyl-phospholipid synthase
MLYKFKSKIEGDLIMLELHALHILQIIGKEAGPKGIILPADMPAAIAALEQAITHDEAAKLAASQAIKETMDDPEVNPVTADVVSLRQRSLPFINLLKSCHVANASIVWGV